MTDIARNAAEFSRQLSQLSHYVDGNIERVIRKACIDLYRRIVERTPIYTGLAKISWGLSTTGYAPEYGEDFEPTYNEILNIVERNVRDFRFTVNDNMVTIVNNLEYIEYLESGSSRQAPTGMVAISLAEFNAHFREALARIEGFENI
jgi:hypothetical protein